MKWPEKKVHLNFPKQRFKDYLIDFWGPYSDGPTMLFWTLNALSGDPGFGDTCNTKESSGEGSSTDPPKGGIGLVVGDMEHGVFLYMTLQC